MNFRNSLLFLAEMIGKIDNIEIDRKLRIDWKETRRKNNFSFVRHLTEFDKDKDFILVNGRQAKVGTILKRPLDIAEKISNKKFEFHYAVVLGTSIKGKEILIEMTKGKGVSLVTKQGFLVNRFKEEQIEFEFSPIKLNIKREELIERAKELQFHSYHLLDLNCKVFVEYIVLKIATPQRVKEFKKAQINICNYAIMELKNKLSETQDELGMKHLTKRILESEKDKQRLILAVEETEKKNKP